MASPTPDQLAAMGGAFNSEALGGGRRPPSELAPLVEQARGNINPDLVGPAFAKLIEAQTKVVDVQKRAAELQLDQTKKEMTNSTELSKLRGELAKINASNYNSSESVALKTKAAEMGALKEWEDRMRSVIEYKVSQIMAKGENEIREMELDQLQRELKAAGLENVSNNVVSSAVEKLKTDMEAKADKALVKDKTGKALEIVSAVRTKIQQDLDILLSGGRMQSGLLKETGEVNFAALENQVNELSLPLEVYNEVLSPIMGVVVEASKRAGEIVLKQREQSKAERKLNAEQRKRYMAWAARGLALGYLAYNFGVPSMGFLTQIGAYGGAGAGVLTHPATMGVGSLLLLGGARRGIDAGFNLTDWLGGAVGSGKEKRVDIKALQEEVADSRRKLVQASAEATQGVIKSTAEASRQIRQTFEASVNLGRM